MPSMDPLYICNGSCHCTPQAVFLTPAPPLWKKQVAPVVQPPTAEDMMRFMMSTMMAGYNPFQPPQHPQMLQPSSIPPPITPGGYVLPQQSSLSMHPQSAETIRHRALTPTMGAPRPQVDPSLSVAPSQPQLLQDPYHGQLSGRGGTTRDDFQSHGGAGNHPPRGHFGGR